MRVWIAVVLLAGCAADAPAGPLNEFDDGLQATDTTGVIRGIVVDPTITPVPDAVITLQGLDREARSNPDGAFGFGDLEPGAYFLTTSKPGYNSTQTSITVEAGVDRPPVVKVLLEPNPSLQPFIEEITFQGFLACGVAVFYTSVGCTTFGFIAGITDSEAIWGLDFDVLPGWAQGELVWTDTQPLSGKFIWQIVPSEYPGSPQPHIGYMETEKSPALAYLNQSAIEENGEWMLDKGVDYRFFAGPHELCPAGTPEGVNRFGCGATLEQETQVFIHHFYNFAPEPGWRFTSDGAHPIPEGS